MAFLIFYKKIYKQDDDQVRWQDGSCWKRKGRQTDLECREAERDKKGLLDGA